MGLTQVKALMAELKLTGMTHALERISSEAKRHEMTLEEILDLLLQAQADHQRHVRMERRIKYSRLKQGASFEDFDLKTKRSITKGELREMMSLSWLKDGRPLVLIGQTGVGKTYLAQACGLKACQDGRTVLFLSMTRWLDEHAGARETATTLKFREKIIRPDLLILDDFGMRKLTALEAEDFREVLEERSYGKSTLVTTQLPFDHWSEVIPDPVLSEAIVDRLEQPALIYKITGESYRKTKAQKLASEEKKQ
jgi:DNA replication protein DnaC